MINLKNLSKKELLEGLSIACETDAGKEFLEQAT